jgi:hypothetical protein
VPSSCLRTGTFANGSQDLNPGVLTVHLQGDRGQGLPVDVAGCVPETSNSSRGSWVTCGRDQTRLAANCRESDGDPVRLGTASSARSTYTGCGAASIWVRIQLQNRVNADPVGISLTVARTSAVANDTEPPIRPRDCSNDAIEP